MAKVKLYFGGGWLCMVLLAVLAPVAFAQNLANPLLNLSPPAEDNPYLPPSGVEPLKVSAGAIPWQDFASTKTKEKCIITKAGFNDCRLHPIYNQTMLQYNGQKVKVMGYMFPLENTEKQKFFLIGPYPLSCPFHYHSPNAEIVVVKTKKPIAFSYKPILLEGRLKVAYDKETELFYELNVP